MEYLKLKVKFKPYPKRFYRTLLVRPDMNLVDLGCILVTALEGAFEHCFLFETRDFSYEPIMFLTEGVNINSRLMDDYTINDLGEKFDFVYDTGCNYEFACSVMKKRVEISDEESAYLIDGAGQGIWEDYIGELYDYLDGKIDPSSQGDDVHQLPWNFDNTCFGDFDTAFNLEDAQDKFIDSYEADIYNYKEHIYVDFSNKDYQNVRDKLLYIKTNKITNREFYLGAVSIKIVNDEVLYLIEYQKQGYTSFTKTQTEYGETADDAVIKKIKEETNLDVMIDISVTKTITYPPENNILKYVTYLIAGVISDNVIKQKNEAIEYEFLPYEKAYDALTYDLDKALLKEVNEYILNKRKKLMQGL